MLDYISCSNLILKNQKKKKERKKEKKRSVAHFTKEFRPLCSLLNSDPYVGVWIQHPCAFSAPFNTWVMKTVSQSLKRVKSCVSKGAEFSTLQRGLNFFLWISFCLKSHWFLLWIDLNPIFSPFLLWNKNGGLVLNQLILDL